MPHISEVFALESRIDNFVKRAEEISDLYLQAHFGRYLAILTAGYFEKAIQSAIVEFARQRSNEQVTRFVESQISWEGSINRSKFKAILDRFDADIFHRVEGSVDEEAKAAVDSVKTLRDQLAHGNDNGTGYGTIKGYHFGVRRYVRAVIQELCP